VTPLAAPVVAAGAAANASGANSSAVAQISAAPSVAARVTARAQSSSKHYVTSTRVVPGSAARSIDSDTSENQELRMFVFRSGVVGAGEMGSEIAAVIARQGSRSCSSMPRPTRSPPAASAPRR